MNNNEEMNTNEEKSEKKNAFSSAWKKTVNFGKKAAETVQKGAEVVSEQTKKTLHEQKLKKYNPLFPKNFKSKDFKLPYIIEIVDEAVRRNVDVCEGAIGWTEVVNDTEVLYLYDDFVKKSGIRFLPTEKCNCVYCADTFDKNCFIQFDCIFGRASEEKLAELENIAYLLGAKSCSIEVVEADMKSDFQKSKVGVGMSKTALGNESVATNKYGSTQSGRKTTYFNGHNEPQRPELKWFAYDNNIKQLIEMRCNDIGSVKSTFFELSGTSSATMTQKAAQTIDKLLKISGSRSMESQVIKEYSKKLVFEIEF